jgi:hypothetical protein
MQTITELRISPNSLASDDSIEKSAPYMELARRVGLRFAVRLLRSDLRHRLCICRDGLRSLRGHIRTQSAIGQVYVRLGPHSDQGARDARTLVRTLYIQKLLAIRPWGGLSRLRNVPSLPYSVLWREGTCHHRQLGGEFFRRDSNVWLRLLESLGIEH